MKTKIQLFFLPQIDKGRPARWLRELTGESQWLLFTALWLWTSQLSKPSPLFQMKMKILCLKKTVGRLNEITPIMHLTLSGKSSPKMLVIIAHLRTWLVAVGTTWSQTSKVWIPVPPHPQLCPCFLLWRLDKIIPSS